MYLIAILGINYSISMSELPIICTFLGKKLILHLKCFPGISTFDYIVDAINIICLQKGFFYLLSPDHITSA